MTTPIMGGTSGGSDLVSVEVDAYEPSPRLRVH